MPHAEERPLTTGPVVTIGFALLYAALGFVVHSSMVHGTSLHGTSFGLAWPAGGVAVLWFLVQRARPLSLDTALLALGVYTVNVLTGAGQALSLLLVLTNAAQTLVAVALMRRWCPDLWGCGGRRSLDSPRVLFRFLAAACVGLLVGTVLGAVGNLALSGAFRPIDGLLWFDRNLCGVLVLTILGLLVGQRLSSPQPRAPLSGGGGARRLELVAAAAFTGVVYATAFLLESLPLAFPLIVATVWFGLRFATLLSAWHSLFVGCVTVALTLAGLGPFAAVSSPEVGALLAQFFVATMVVTGLALSVGRAEQAATAIELRRTEAEAVYQARLLTAIVGSMAEGLAVLDDTGEFLVRNPAAAALLALDRSPLGPGGRYPDGTVIPADEEPLARALRGETVRDMEVLSHRSGAPARILCVSAIPLPRDELRDRARAMLLLHDVTSEHARRAELVSFAGVVAHDLRNPLAAIDGWTEVIGDELEAGELDLDLLGEFITRVRSSSARMGGLIQDLLAHATSKDGDLRPTRVDLTGMVGDVVEARGAGGLVTWDPLPVAYADPVLVSQVLDNLLGNALKYVAPGVEPKVEVTGSASRPGWISIEVTDNGIGLPEGEHELVFDEFHRAHSAGYEGTGLGLSICRRIVDRHGGAIEARDNPLGQGTTFAFTLPAVD